MFMLTSVRWSDNVLRWFAELLREGFGRVEVAIVGVCMHRWRMVPMLGYISRCRLRLGRLGIKTGGEKACAE